MRIGLDSQRRISCHLRYMVATGWRVGPLPTIDCASWSSRDLRLGCGILLRGLRDQDDNVVGLITIGFAATCALA